MPLDRIYVTRHANRLGWTIDLSTGTYRATFPTPTGIPNDPTLTAYGLRQSQELAAHLASEEFEPKPCRVYSSPFYRCLETIRPSVEALKEKATGAEDLVVRTENGLGDWFGYATYFTHPAPASRTELQSHFPSILTSSSTSTRRHDKSHVIPPPHGETIPQLHDRLALTLSRIVAEVDSELDAEEEKNREGGEQQSRAILICTHAASLIAIGRALTGNMPEDPSEVDFRPFTAGLSTFVRRGRGKEAGSGGAVEEGGELDWKGGKGIGGGWDCVGNGECGFLSGGEERGWNFNGEESFDSVVSSDDTAPKL
ncbi:hypothetical protein FQN54_001208 [Arachnomyces sp. PD_36]|nr:hypothetical protein FQN54_001208 [Arachnomyces sp. PD_36]